MQEGEHFFNRKNAAVNINPGSNYIYHVWLNQRKLKHVSVALWVLFTGIISLLLWTKTQRWTFVPLHIFCVLCSTRSWSERNEWAGVITKLWQSQSLRASGFVLAAVNIANYILCSAASLSKLSKTQTCPPSTSLLWTKLIRTWCFQPPCQQH